MTENLQSRSGCRTGTNKNNSLVGMKKVGSRFNRGSSNTSCDKTSYYSFETKGPMTLRENRRMTTSPIY